MTTFVEPDKKPSLVKKLCEVMKAVPNIPKGGHNKQQDYDYVRDVDVLDTIRGELAKRNVFLTHSGEEVARGEYSTKTGALMHSVSVKLTFYAHDGDSGESMQLSVGLGEAADAGDKSIYKATTGAAKYALLKAFLVPTMDDPEADEAVDAAHAAATAPRASAPATTIPTPARPAQPKPQADSGAVFPFGKNKGQPIRGAALKDVKWFAGAVAQSIEDPEKARFEDKNRELLAALNAEISRQGGQPEEADAPF